jgi:hypothetical protein
MFNYFTSVAVPLLASVAIPSALPSVFPPPPVNAPPFAIIREFPTDKTATKEVAPEKPKEKRLICRGCNDNENRTLAFLQDQGITDKNALATIMGNIKQESQFDPKVCEGGYRTSYGSCGGGYGLIQWTTSNRYYGLGRHARRNGLSPSSLDAQLSYMLTEPQWKEIENRMKTPGRSIYSYMHCAYDWIGWGYHGARTDYAYNYASKITVA